MSKVLREGISLTGAGRTDTGVNARVMYAHFDTQKKIENPDAFVRSLNHLCGRAIAIHELIRVADDAHARFDAVSRTYRYFISFDKCPFLRYFSWLSPVNLDVDAMNEAADLLRVTDDFTSFAKLHSDAATNICKVTEAEWKRWDNQYGVPGIMFTITADRFLRNMVRAVVGTLVEVGRGKLTPDGFRSVIEDKNRCSAGTSMPAEALFLWDISYPYIH